MKIFVKVKTGSLEDKLEKVDESHYVAFVKSLPIKGRANASLLKLIAKEFNVLVKDVVIKTLQSRKKIIEVNLT
ncbi:MAG: DUF167 domain-containing protein [Candidatus Pacearchaeota archaeon]